MCGDMKVEPGEDGVYGDLTALRVSGIGELDAVDSNGEIGIGEGDGEDERDEPNEDDGEREVIRAAACDGCIGKI